MRPDNPLETEPIVRRRMPELDTIRGVAILMVVVFHGFGPIFWSMQGRPVWQRAIFVASRQGWAGVNLFFVLSGFLITGILLDSVGKPRYYARFYSRRALRILPVYYLMLLVILVWNYSIGTPPVATLVFVGLSFIYLSNMVPLFGVINLYPLLWSLSVEEHFYLLWPTVIHRLSRRGIAMVALSICVMVPALRMYALNAWTEPWWGGPHYIGTFAYTWMAADGLSLGALLALLARSSWGKRNNFLKLSLVVLAAAGVGTTVSLLLPQALADGLRGTLVNYYALAVVAGTLWLGTGARRRWVNIRWLSFYGYISYGLYLVHGWIYGVYGLMLRKFAPSWLAGVTFGNTCLRLVICTLVATAVAYLSRVTYEEFFLRVKDNVTPATNPEGAEAAA